MTREMADRSILRFNFAPLQSGVNVAWKTFTSKVSPRPNLKATHFGRVIQPLETGDQSLAFAMYAGIFRFAGESQRCSPAHVFDRPLGSSDWQRQLYDLHWLKHFAASNSTLHAHFALRLIGRWAKSRKSPRDVESLSNIVVALATHGQALALKCNDQVKQEFLFIFSQYLQKLQRKSAHNAGLATGKAIAELYACAAFRGLENTRAAAASVFQASINKIILSDGGHIDRDPNRLVQLLALILPLQTASVFAGQQMTFAAVDRMVPMLRLLTHGDSSLAHTTNTHILIDLTQKILKTDLTKAKQTRLAAQSGFAKLEGKKSCLIADTKNNFAIEFSDGVQRVFNNNVNHSKIADKTELKQSAQGNLLSMTSAQGFERNCFLSTDGSDLRVEDAHPSTLEIRFDIHPSIKVSSLREGRGFLLVSPDREAWTLSFRGAEIHTEQNGLVIKVINLDHRCINWALKKQTKITRTGSRTNPNMPDLLDL
jgi:uncharacterized heparinase superfamily protein